MESAAIGGGLPFFLQLYDVNISGQQGATLGNGKVRTLVAVTDSEAGLPVKRLVLYLLRVLPSMKHIITAVLL